MNIKTDVGTQHILSPLNLSAQYSCTQCSA